MSDHTPNIPLNLLTVVFPSDSKMVVNYREGENYLTNLTIEIETHHGLKTEAHPYEGGRGIHAFDLHFREKVEPAVQLKILNLVHQHTKKIDFCWQNHETRAKNLLVSDLDSTMIRAEILDLLGEGIGRADAISLITQEGMEGKIDFDTSLRKRVKMFHNQKLSPLKKYLLDIKLYAGARTLVQTMRYNGAKTVLVSGSFHPFADTYSDRIGFHELHCNNFQFAKDDPDLLTGEIEGEIINQLHKKKILKANQEKLGLENHEIVSVGDGSNDLQMLQSILPEGLAVGHHSKLIVKEAIPTQILYTDLSSILYFQGIPQDQWIED